MAAESALNFLIIASKPPKSRLMASRSFPATGVASCKHRPGFSSWCPAPWDIDLPAPGRALVSDQLCGAHLGWAQHLPKHAVVDVSCAASKSVRILRACKSVRGSLPLASKPDKCSTAHVLRCIRMSLPQGPRAVWAACSHILLCRTFAARGLRTFQRAHLRR